MPLYDENNPHPEFGKNPNIRNVQGHTEYPKFVTDEKGEKVVVNNPTEEEEVAAAVEAAKAEAGEGEVVEEIKAAKTKKNGWGK